MPYDADKIEDLVSEADLEIYFRFDDENDMVIDGHLSIKDLKFILDTIESCKVDPPEYKQPDMYSPEA